MDKSKAQVPSSKAMLTDKPTPIFTPLFFGGCKNDCDICGGQSYIRYDVPVGHAQFGKIHKCPNIAKQHLYEEASNE